MNNGSKRPLESDYRDRLYRAYVSAPTGARASGGAASEAPSPYLERLVRQSFPRDRDSAILDLGCGSGGLLRVLGGHGYRNVTGVDVSAEQVAEAQRLGTPGVRCDDLLGALASMPERTLDVVVAFDVLEHFQKAEVLELIDHVRRVLRAGGRWIIHVPNADSPFGMRIRYGDFTHELAFTAGALRQVLGASGFGRVETFEDTPVVHGPTSALRWAAWKVIRLGLMATIAAETGSFDRNIVLSQNLLAVAYKD